MMNTMRIAQVSPASRHGIQLHPGRPCATGIRFSKSDTVRAMLSFLLLVCWRCSSLVIKKIINYERKEW